MPRSRVGQHRNFTRIADEEDEEEEGHKTLLFVCRVFWSVEMILKLTFTYGSVSLKNGEKNKRAWHFLIWCFVYLNVLTDH